MPIDFTLTPAQLVLQQQCRAFAATHLRGVDGLTRHLPTPAARFLATQPLYAEMVKAGFLRRMIPQPFGGEGTGLLDMAVLTEEFYAVDANVSLTLLATLLGLMPIFLGGTPAQIGEFVAPFLSGEGTPLAALCNSEPGGSANYASPPPGEGVRTTAVMDGDEWVISGEKQWMNASGWHGDGVDVMCVVCRTDPAAGAQGISLIAVPKPARGFELVHLKETLGNRAHPAPRLRLDKVRVPHDNLIGPAGGGREIIDASFTGTAALVGIMGVGLMRAAFDFALQFAKTEKRGGTRPIIEHQAVGYALADAKSTLEAARLVGWKACHAMDVQAPGAQEMALHSKIFGSEAAVRVITSLMGVVGVDSYDHELPLAGMLQDALVLPLFDGGNMGVRRRQLHELMMRGDYDALAASGG